MRLEFTLANWKLKIHLSQFFFDELDTQIFYKKIEIGSFIGLNKEYNRKHKNK